MKKLKKNEDNFENGNWSIKKLYDVCDGKRYLEKRLINFLNIKVGKSGKYPYDIVDFYMDQDTFCIVYTNNNDLSTGIGDEYYEVNKEDFNELNDILNNPDKDIYFHLPQKI